MISLALLLAAAPFSVLTASSTNDAPVACLLEPTPTCTWRSSAGTGAGDIGVDEGIGFRFESALACEQLEVVLEQPSPKPPLDASFGAYGQAFTTRDEGKTWKTSCFPSKTLFLRVLPSPAPLVIKSVRLLSASTPLVPELPRAVKATVTASSVLAPATAYQPAFLFDSRSDLAWASDGKTTDGKGVVVTVELAEPHAIAGVMLWNGYHRSTTHFTANSRISKLTVKAEGKSHPVVPSTSAMDPQRLAFPALPPAKKIEVVIDAVAPGVKYRDLVVSELRFIDDRGRILAPAVVVDKTAANAATAPLLDRSYAGAVSSIKSATLDPYCVDRRLRVRTGGSFVIYTGDENAPDGNGVIEGGWENGKKGLRIFGKKYRTVFSEGYYGDVQDIVPEIFQSDLELVAFAKVSAAEQKQAVRVVYDLAGDGITGFKGERIAFARDGSVLAKATSYDALASALTKKLIEQNAVLARSSVYTDVLVPTDTAGACKR